MRLIFNVRPYNQMENQIRHYANKLEYEIDAWDLCVAVEKGERIMILDVRSTVNFAEEHIVGAVNIPHRTITQESTNHLDKSMLYVVYCDGIGCNASTKGALNMARLGFRVKELIGGLDWWKRDGYKTATLSSN